MGRYLLRRLIQVPPLLLAVSVVVFALLRLSPGDPAERILSEGGAYRADAAAVARLRGELGLDRAPPVQYALWLKGLLSGDLGRSFATGRPVTQEIAERLPATLALAGAALVLAVAVALPLGVVSALRPGGLVDAVCRMVCLAGVSMPVFWLALLLAWVFAVRLGWLPAIGSGGPQHLVLPAVTLAAGVAATLARLVRASMVEVLREEYVTVARAKGLRGRTVLLRHALRNALIGPVTALGLSVGSLLGGAVVVETCFAYPGFGKLAIDAISTRNYPVIQAFVLLMTLVFVVCNLLVDVLYAALDPRIRVGGAAG